MQGTPVNADCHRLAAIAGNRWEFSCVLRSAVRDKGVGDGKGQ